MQIFFVTTQRVIHCDSVSPQVGHVVYFWVWQTLRIVCVWGKYASVFSHIFSVYFVSLRIRYIHGLCFECLLANNTAVHYLSNQTYRPSRSVILQWSLNFIYETIWWIPITRYHQKPLVLQLEWCTLIYAKWYT